VGRVVDEKRLGQEELEARGGAVKAAECGVAVDRAERHGAADLRLIVNHPAGRSVERGSAPAAALGRVPNVQPVRPASKPPLLMTLVAAAGEADANREETRPAANARTFLRTILPIRPIRRGRERRVSSGSGILSRLWTS